MNKKAFILCSAGVLSLGLLVATNAGVSSSKGIIKADDAHSGHDKTKLMEIGFDWKDPTKVGYKPYWRCPDCCSSNPAASRYDYEDKATVRTESELTLPALTKADISDSTDEIKDIDTTKASNIDQTTACYVTDNSKTVAYFSRSRKLPSNDDDTTDEFDDDPSTFGFTHTGDDAITSVTFSYRYKSWNYTLSKGTSNSYASCKFAYTKDNAATETSYSLDNKIFNDDAWHEVTITAKEVNGGASFSSLIGLTFEFADLRGYFMISGLTYNTEATDTSLNVQKVSFGSVDTSDVDSAITDCSIDTVSAYADEACKTAIGGTTTKISDIADKKIYIKVPLKFGATTSGERQKQDYAVGRLEMSVALDDNLREKASCSAKLAGFASGTWFANNVTYKFIDSASTQYGTDGYSGTIDTAITTSGIYALVALDFNQCDATYDLSHVINAFSIKAKWSAYSDAMSDFNSKLKPLAYIRGDKSDCGWSSDLPIYQMVPDVSYVGDSGVCWVYKLQGFSALKVVYNGNWKNASSVSGGSVDETSTTAYGNAKLTSTSSYYVRYWVPNDFWNDSSKEQSTFWVTQ